VCLPLEHMKMLHSFRLLLKQSFWFLKIHCFEGGNLKNQIELFIWYWKKQPMSLSICLWGGNGNMHWCPYILRSWNCCQRWQHGKKYLQRKQSWQQEVSLSNVVQRFQCTYYSKFPDVQGIVDTVKEFIDFIVSGFRFVSYIHDTQEKQLSSKHLRSSTCFHQFFPLELIGKIAKYLMFGAWTSISSVTHKCEEPSHLTADTEAVAVSDHCKFPIISVQSILKSHRMSRRGYTSLPWVWAVIERIHRKNYWTFDFI
jgi:hypothetical protein